MGLSHLSTCPGFPGAPGEGNASFEGLLFILDEKEARVRVTEKGEAVGRCGWLASLE